MDANDLATVEWLEPWGRITSPAMARGMEAEVNREIGPDHVLNGADVEALAFNGADDVLFRIRGSSPRLAVVHLTYSGKQDTFPSFPSTVFYPTVQHFVDECMRPDHEGT
jgi:hypothetical protein